VQCLEYKCKLREAEEQLAYKAAAADKLAAMLDRLEASLCRFPDCAVCADVSKDKIEKRESSRQRLWQRYRAAREL
jgi:hypothetical protein